MANTKVSDRIWIITATCKVAPLADLPPGESVKWWCREGDDHWQPGTPPGTVATAGKKQKQTTAAAAGGLFSR
jgi:hypothetical protein